MRLLSDLAGTLLSFFRIGTHRLKSGGDTVEVRNKNDTEDRDILVRKLEVRDPSSGEVVSISIPSTSPSHVLAGYDLFFPKDAGNDGDVLQTDGNGNLSWVADQNTVSHFEPFVIDSTPELVNISGSEYYTEIQQSYGNLIAVDADVGTYEEIDIRISSEWTTSQVGTFRLDLDVKSGQTFTFDSSIEGISEVTFPETAGVVSLLFDKPYGSSTWYVRQSV